MISRTSRAAGSSRCGFDKRLSSKSVKASSTSGSAKSVTATVEPKGRAASTRPSRPLRMASVIPVCGRKPKTKPRPSYSPGRAASRTTKPSSSTVRCGSSGPKRSKSVAPSASLAVPRSGPSAFSAVRRFGRKRPKPKSLLSASAPKKEPGFFGAPSGAGCAVS